MDYPTYNPEQVQYMRDELTAVGFKEVFTIDEVDQYLNKSDETVLIFINSVCGCSAGCARPGVSAALQNTKIPDNIITLLAGQEKTAIEHIRNQYLSDYQPSSPNIILFKNGKVLKNLERIQIQGLTADMLSNQVVEMFNMYCNKQGPSIPAQDYNKLNFTINCGSSIDML